MRKVTQNIAISEALREDVRRIATLEKRSFSGMVEMLLTTALKQYIEKMEVTGEVPVSEQPAK